MKKLIKTLLTVASIATVMGFASCNNPNDNVAQRGITITGVQISAFDTSNKETPISLAQKLKYEKGVADELTTISDIANGDVFVLSGDGLDSKWKFDKELSFSGIALNGVIKCVPGKKLDSSEYTYIYSDPSFCGYRVSDGSECWNISPLQDGKIVKNSDGSFKEVSGANWTVKNPKDGGTYYIDVKLKSNDAAEVTLVEGTLVDYLYITSVELNGFTPESGETWYLKGYNGDWNNTYPGTLVNGVLTFDVNAYNTRESKYNYFAFATDGWSKSIRALAKSSIDAHSNDSYDSGDPNIIMPTDKGGRCKLVCTYDSTEKAVVSVKLVSEE